jgi:glucose-1-phosphate adenylyltransferase
MARHDSVEDALVCLLAGGSGERLYPLTRDRAKPAVPFGGIYRIIDLTLSNCVNSGLRRIFVLTQYKSLSLNSHIRAGWYHLFPGELGEFIFVLPPMMRTGEHWYQGTADAIYQNLYSLESERHKYVLVLAGDHVYKMNYNLLLKQHAASGADLTIAVIDFDRSDAARFGICELDHENRIISWEEKPADPKPSPNHPGKCLVSMGIYCFNREFLVRILKEDAENRESRHDFGRDLIPKLIDKSRVYAYNFIDENRKASQYWRDIGTIEAYYEANMDLVAVTPVFNLYDDRWPIRTYQRQYPPAKFVFAEDKRRGIALDSIVSMGSIISGGCVQDSVLSHAVRVEAHAMVEKSILFPHSTIGRNAHVRRAIIERKVYIPAGARIGFNLEEDRKKYHVTESGIVVVVPEDRAFKK